MTTQAAATGVILRQDLMGGEVGRAIQCKGCGELGRASWERGMADSFNAAPQVTRLSGNFYLHNSHIACGRCQQIYRAD